MAVKQYSRVPPEGPRDARIAIVGESPGIDELRKGRPFVGRAGEQLDRMLAGAGILRKDCYITNLLKSVPDGPKEEWFFNGGSPSQAMFQGMLELLEELQGVKPNVVVPLGNPALWALTGRMEILKRRGSIMEATAIPGLKVIPTIHPAFYVHGHYAMSYKEPLGIWDFARIQEESQTPDINLPSFDAIINPTSDQVNEAVERLLSGDHITADSEWYSPDSPAYIAFTNDPSWAICLSPKGRLYEVLAIKELCESNVPKIWQNAAFDAVALDRMGMRVRNVRDDLMVAWNAAWGDLREKRLSTISSVLTRYPYYKDDGDFVGKDDRRGKLYCCTDTVVTEESMQRMEQEEFPYTRSRKGYEISMSIMDAMLESSYRGIRVDRAKLKSTRESYEQGAEELNEKLNTVLGRSINVRSSKQVCDLIYDELGIRRKKRTSKQEVLLDIAASTDVGVVKTIITGIIRIRAALNMVSRYLGDDIVDHDGRCRTNWNVAGTRSGRLSATEPWWGGLPLQTIPDARSKFRKELGNPRDVFIPDPGCVFIGHDLGQAEAFVVAALTGDEELLRDLVNRIDIHCKLASRMPFNLSFEELVALCKERGKDNVPERYLSKKTRHASNYIMGSGTLQLTINREYLDTGVGVNTSTARTLHRSYLNLAPGLELWWMEVKNKLRREKRLTNVLGRSRQFTGNVDNSLPEAVSFEPQSTVADMTTLAMSRSLKRIRCLDPEAQAFVHMHDGSLFQVRDEVADEALAILEEEAKIPLTIKGIDLAIPVETKRGMSWGEMD